MSQGGAVVFMGGTSLKCLFQNVVYFFMLAFSGAYELLTISLTERGIYNAEI